MASDLAHGSPPVGAIGDGGGDSGVCSVVATGNRSRAAICNWTSAVKKRGIRCSLRRHANWGELNALSPESLLMLLTCLRVCACGAHLRLGACYPLSRLRASPGPGFLRSVPRVAQRAVVQTAHSGHTACAPALQWRPRLPVQLQVVRSTRMGDIGGAQRKCSCFSTPHRSELAADCARGSKKGTVPTSNLAPLLASWHAD